jgi:hypothetical protein
MLLTFLQRGRRLLAHRVDSLKCEGSDAIGAKRTCRERRERVDLTKMTHKRHARLGLLLRKVINDPYSAGRNFLI